MTARTLVLLVLALTSAAHAFTPQELWQQWPEERFVATPAPCLLHTELTTRLGDLADLHADNLTLEVIGRSVQGRAIHLLTLGRGEETILLWSQMHGDETSATPALLDIASYLLEHADEPGSRAILEGVTLLMIPMLNPDGAQVYERRNAQAIDINRDALNLATPEGRILKQIRDQHQPLLGFNLHDQNRRTAVGNTKRLDTNAVLAVAGDPKGSVTPGRLRAKRACSAIVEALAPFEIAVDGWSAYKWLDDVTLERMGRLGVGTVSWAVKRRRSAAAVSLVRTLNRQGRPQVRVIAAQSSVPKVVLSKPPTEPEDNSLLAGLRALGIEGAFEERLQDLWPHAAEAASVLPALRPGQPASFLLVTPAPEGRIDFDKARLSSIWLAGHEFSPSP